MILDLPSVPGNRSSVGSIVPFLFCSKGVSQPYRIDIFEDYIYGTGLKHEVFKIHKYGKQQVEFLSLGLEKPTNVLISHRHKQQDGEQQHSDVVARHISQCNDRKGAGRDERINWG